MTAELRHFLLRVRPARCASIQVPLKSLRHLEGSRHRPPGQRPATLPGVTDALLLLR